MLDEKSVVVRRVVDQPGVVDELFVPGTHARLTTGNPSNGSVGNEPTFRKR